MISAWVRWAAVGALAMSLAACGDSGATPPASTAPAGTHPAATGGSAAGGMVDLKLTLPKPAFIGTPQNLPEWAQREMTDSKPQPVLKIPAGCTNVALGKPVTASGASLNGVDLAVVTDGNKEGEAGRYVELAPGPQWFQIDLKQPYAIYAIAVWRYHQNTRVFHGVVVQVSDDKDFLSGVTTLFNNDATNADGQGVGKDKEFVDRREGQRIDAKGVKARYVRLYSNGNTADEENQLEEVEVYGVPVK